MSKIKEFYESLADMVQSWNKSTISIIMGVLAVIAFYCLAKFIKGNKADSTKVNNTGTFITFLISLGIIILFVSCLKY